MTFHKLRAVLSQSFPSVLIGNSALGRVHEARYLGVILDPYLKIGLHIHSVTMKLVKSAPIIYRVRKVLNIECLKLTYYYFVRPSLINCPKFTKSDLCVTERHCPCYLWRAI